MNGAGTSGEGPLAGVTVCLTRSQGSNESLRRRAVAAGADVVEMPLIEIRCAPKEPIEAALSRLPEYDGVIVTSANAAAIASDCAAKGGIDIPATVPWYAIGRATASTAALASLPTIEFASETGEAFAHKLVQQYGDVSRRLMFLRGNLARSVVPGTLRDAGHEVDEVVCYETQPAMVTKDVWEHLQSRQGIFLPLYSPSAVRSWVQQRKSMLDDRFLVVAIGKTTADACRTDGLTVAATAPEPTADSMLDAMISLWQNSADLHRRR